MKLGQIAAQVNCPVSGNGDLVITGVAPIETAGPGEITFVSNRKYIKHLATSQASAVIVSQAEIIPSQMSGLISGNPYLTFAEILELFAPPRINTTNIHATAVISPSARLGRDVTIGPYVVIGDQAVIQDGVTILAHSVIYPEAVIGSNAFIHAHCIVRERCRVGARVILQNNVTIGADGFGYAKRNDGSWKKIVQTGVVLIEDEVEVGAGATIDRATIGATIVRRGAKIDNLVQVGHGSQVGEDTLLCAQVGLAGSSHIGNQVILSGQVGVAGHLKIGDGVIATAQTGIPNSVEEKQVISGYPAINNRDWLKSSALFAQLPKINKEVIKLKAEMAKLHAHIGQFLKSKENND